VTCKRYLGNQLRETSAVASYPLPIPTRFPMWEVQRRKENIPRRWNSYVRRIIDVVAMNIRQHDVTGPLSFGDHKKKHSWISISQHGFPTLAIRNKLMGAGIRSIATRRRTFHVSRSPIRYTLKQVFSTSFRMRSAVVTIRLQIHDRDPNSNTTSSGV